VFVQKSATAPRNLFQRDGIFSSPSASRLFSHTLTAEEVRRLSKTLGYMPCVLQLRPDAATRNSIQERVMHLDEGLRMHVQSICDRFQKSNAPPHCGTFCRGWWTWIGRMFHIGVIREVMPQVVFFLVFTIALQFYGHMCDWDFRWSAANQDTIYYPALTMSFLLSFRSSACMERYGAGCECIFRMEKALRELAFDVVTRLASDVPDEVQAGGVDNDKSLKQRYFKHEFRRLIQVLFACAARDLNDSAGDGEDIDDEVAVKMKFSLTDLEQAAVHVTHSSAGHAFRVYMAAAWLDKLVRGAQEASLFDDKHVSATACAHLSEFKDAWIKARDVAYSNMPDSIIHLLWVLAVATNFVVPWEYLTVCRWMTWLPSLFLSTSFFGIMQISGNLENPFGVDEDDIPVWEVAEHLDEEVALIMFYSALDEVGGENLYRGLAAQDHIFIA